jgi:DNA polymerase III subunit epsilon
MNTDFLTGSDKQKKWAASVIHDFHKRYPDAVLPVISSADYWIKHRAASLEDVIQDMPQFSSPFSSTYPRYGRNDAIETARQLNERIIVLDLETTGLKRGTDEIVEIAIVNYQTGAILLNTLVRPLDITHYQKSAGKAIHKIDADLLMNNSPCFMDVASTIADSVTASHCVSYNASFDFPFLQYQFLRYGLPVPRIEATCAMRIFSAFMDTDTPISLETACMMLHINREQYGNPHRALADVLATIELLKKIALEDKE